jgi:transposase
MRKLRQALRLAWEAGLGLRPIGHSLGLSPTTVGDYLRRAELAGLYWPLPADLDDAALEARLFPGPPPVARKERPLPELADVHRELRRKGCVC